MQRVSSVSEEAVDSFVTVLLSFIKGDADA